MGEFEMIVEDRNEEPFTPQQAMEAKINAIPDFVVRSVNGLLARRVNINNPHANIILKQKDVVDQIIKESAQLGITVSVNDIFTNKYLDFEELYRRSGWEVTYSKPAYEETFEAYFTFKAKKQ